MKTTSTEIESLRAEVRALRGQIADLEATLCAAENENGEDEEFRALWPYSWIVSGVECVSHGFHSFQLRAIKKKVERHSQQELEAFQLAQGSENCPFEHSALRAI